MPYPGSLYAAFTVVLFLLLSGKAAYAGCPAFPPKERHITVAACRFYDAAQDTELQNKVERHFTDWQDASAAQVLSYKKAVYERNTGAIVTASGSDGSRFELFYRSESPEACTAFPAGEMQRVFTVRTCVMVFFAAPTELVIVPEPPASDKYRDSPSTQPEVP
ncbi:MAG: hypothetical protein HND56_06500 [Pseudomonadota bacterium]|nr:hypothetical protein [Pseudomonadota bacterium]QKK05354.1 MAG: hypothetical protein HND56_06500 [Pseudomonadota bacterium]